MKPKPQTNTKSKSNEQGVHDEWMDAASEQFPQPGFIRTMLLMIWCPITRTAQLRALTGSGWNLLRVALAASEPVGTPIRHPLGLHCFNPNTMAWEAAW